MGCDMTMNSMTVSNVSMSLSSVVEGAISGDHDCGWHGRGCSGHGTWCW